MHPWREISDRVFVRRYRFLDQTIGLVLGEAGALVIDTRSSPAQADELRREIRALTPLPVTAVVTTHRHWDHAWGNVRFPDAMIWGHERCAADLRALAADPTDLAAQAAELSVERPELAPDLPELLALGIRPPDRTVERSADLELGDDHRVEFHHAGRGHTDGDLAVLVRVADAGDVLFAGDLLEGGAPPWFGESFPLAWPTTVEALLALGAGTVVPGHGEPGDIAWARDHHEELIAVAAVVRSVLEGERSLEEGVRAGPYPPEVMREAIERGRATSR